MNYKKIADAVRRWRDTGLGQVLNDLEYTSEEQAEIVRRCERIAIKQLGDRALRECRVNANPTDEEIRENLRRKKG
jgi:hypothetical protein